MKHLIPALVFALFTHSAAATCLPTDWVRHDGPVFRDRLADESYEIASDGHVFLTGENQLAMVYSGDAGDQISIKLAFGDTWNNWREWGALLSSSLQPDFPLHLETPFYYRMSPTDHRIYFIAYADEESYQSQIFMAEAPALTGPWTIQPEPVIARGPMAGRDVYLLTSPSIVAHEGGLVMAWLGWDGFEDVTAVWSFTARSADGNHWDTVAQTQVPIGMEGQISARPDGGFVAVATQETETGREGIFAFCADDPLGPWVPMPDPLLTLTGEDWEVDEIIAPSITYDPQTQTPYLYYTGADYARGWWMMMAHPR